MSLHRFGRPFASCLLLGCCALALTGCARKFTRERFDLIKPGADNQEDVRQILGKPANTLTDVWYYEDLHRNLHAQIFFDDDGRVVDKEWMNANTGEWQGKNPQADEPPQGEVRQRRTNTRRIDKD